MNQANCNVCNCTNKKTSELYKWTLIWIDSYFLGQYEGHQKQVWFCPECIERIREASNLESILLGEDSI